MAGDVRPDLRADLRPRVVHCFVRCRLLVDDRARSVFGVHHPDRDERRRTRVRTEVD